MKRDLKRKKKSSAIITGTLILTLTGIITRIIGFFYRIFLSRGIGEEGMGIYQLIAPVMALSFSVTCAGIQTSISKYTAAYRVKNNGSRALAILFCGLLVSVLLSLSMGMVVFCFSESISKAFLFEVRCAPLLRIYALSLPFAAVHSCINGYYYGRRQTAVPSGTQLLEQLVRVAFVFASFTYCEKNGIACTVSLALFGLVLGEIASSLTAAFCLTVSVRKDTTIHSRSQKAGIRTALSNLSLSAELRPLLVLALPLSVNRIVLNFLQSAEAVWLPRQLCAYGLSSSAALSIYGVLTGMALPLVLFPQAITGSISVLLLPYVSEADARGSRKQISRALKAGTAFCLLMGFCAAVFFFCFGPLTGRLLFRSEEAGLFIRSLSFMCPFLYLGALLTSVLNGLNKAGHAFFINVLALIIRLFCVFFLVPVIGIKGYLFSLPVSQIAHCALNFLALRNYLYYNKSR